MERYKELFCAVATLPNGEQKKKLGDVLFEIVSSVGQREGYPYVEPSDLEGIKGLRKDVKPVPAYDKEKLEEKIHGAWMGRICGCLLGKIIEGIRSDELIPFLKESGNYPLHRYVYRTDVSEETIAKYKFAFKGRHYVDDLECMIPDDDLNYVVMAQEMIEKFGKEFTPNNVATTWLALQSRDCYFTAERVAYCNFLQGFTPPKSAVYKNPYREWIGAQIRGDYFGYVNPGKPEAAAISVEAAYESGNNDPALLERVATYYTLAKRFDKARDVYHKLAALKPGDQRILQLLKNTEAQATMSAGWNDAVGRTLTK